MNSSPMLFMPGSATPEVGIDLLGREPLTRSLAKVFRHQTTKSAQIIGLCGEWGSGKSWVIYRVRQILEESEPGADERQPYWLEFNPWQWNGTDILISEFFAALGKAVETIEAKPQKRWLFKRPVWTEKMFRVYGARLSAHSVVIGGYSQGMAGLSGLVALLATAGYIHDPDTFSIFQLAVATAIAATGGFLKLIADFFGKMSEAKKAEEEWRKKSPREIKDELISKMETLAQPVVVVLDDLDRLTADEIAAVFQLVKAQADFPNVYSSLGLMPRRLRRQFAPQGADLNGKGHLSQNIINGSQNRVKENTSRRSTRHFQNIPRQNYAYRLHYLKIPRCLQRGFFIS